MSKKTIFLDIDGVLATKRHDAVRGLGKVGGHEFDPTAMEMINDLCDSYDAQVVIISSWANQYTRGDLLKYFKEGGFTGDFHEDWRVVDVAQANRGQSIVDWCKAHEVTPRSIVIIDDKLSPIPKSYQNHFVKTDTNNGMSYEAYELAKILLSGRKMEKDEAREFKSAMHPDVAGRSR